MTFQSSVALNQGFGVVGEVVFEGPMRALSAAIKHATAADIVVGRFFTIDATDGTYRPGGTGKAGGILSNPKALSSVGTTANGPLAPTLTVPTGTVGEFVNMGEVIVALGAAVAVGDLALYDTTTGEISSVPPMASVTGSIDNTGLLTVTAVAAGSAPLGVGSVLSTGATILALGTGTGGTGTYQTSDVMVIASTTITAPAVAPSGKAFVPGGKFSRYANAAAGLAVLSLTN